VIVLYAGRRSGTDEFPESNVDFVGEQITQLLAGLRPRRVIGSAAAGADLLALEAAEALGIAADAIIVGDRDAFRAASVSDKGAAWERRYEHQLSRIGAEQLPPHDVPKEGWRAVTRRIVERGEQLAESGEALVVLAVSAPRTTVDHTEELAQGGTRPGRLVLRIDPAKRCADMPRAFVAMPFGVKPYPERGWRRFDANVSYHRVMLPALIDGGYRPIRADTDALLEIIDHTMLREINSADVMLVDLAMLGASVMWELGLRHAWRRSGTVILKPDWVKRPFDIARVPVLSYRRAARHISDADAIHAIRALQPVLRAVPEQRVDSPVFASISGLPEVALPDPPDTGSGGALLEAITRAGDLGDVDELRRLAGRVAEATTLTATARTALLEQTGLQLIALDRHEDARAVLEPLARADAKLERRTMQEQYAHVLIRAGDGGDDARLAEAEHRLEALRRRHGDNGETLGLLGSAAKARVELAVRSGDVPPAGALERAIRAYRRGMEVDPGDPYPGINAVALLRLRAQHWGGGERDLATVRELLPVVRFAASRAQMDADGWAGLTIAECALHACLAGGDSDGAAEATVLYERCAGMIEPRQRRAAVRQLRLMRDAGDPAGVIDPLLALLGAAR
jgi:hypothetical protein